MWNDLLSHFLLKTLSETIISLSPLLNVISTHIGQSHTGRGRMLIPCVWYVYEAQGLAGLVFSLIKLGQDI